jgi:hypothetical protein
MREIATATPLAYPSEILISRFRAADRQHARGEAKREAEGAEGRRGRLSIADQAAKSRNMDAYRPRTRHSRRGLAGVLLERSATLHYCPPSSRG